MKFSPLLALRFAVILSFLGRAWQHLFLNTVYREFLWDYKLMSPIVEGYFKMGWSQYLNSAKAEQIINYGEVLGGCIFLGAAIQAAISKGKRSPFLLLFAFLLLLPIAWMHFLGNAYNSFMLLEFTAQASAPLLLIWALRSKAILTGNTFKRAIILVLSVTFTCHGLYAVGAFPVPQKFIAMAQSCLGLNELQSLRFLALMGYLDFVAVVLLYFTATKKWAALYMVGWGFITAYARIWANFYSFDPWNSLWHWTPDFLFRGPHYLLALCLYLLYPIKKLSGIQLPLAFLRPSA